MFFQHDGAPPHFSNQIRNHLNDTYPDRWVGRGDPHLCPARSPDLNPVDYFLWDHLKTDVYNMDINDRAQLLQRIVECCSEISEIMIRKSIGHLVIRTRKCTEAGGGHFEHKI